MRSSSCSPASTLPEMSGQHYLDVDSLPRQLARGQQGERGREVIVNVRAQALTGAVLGTLPGVAGGSPGSGRLAIAEQLVQDVDLRAQARDAAIDQADVAQQVRRHLVGVQIGAAAPTVR